MYSDAGGDVHHCRLTPNDDIAAIVSQVPRDTMIEQEVIRGADEPNTPEQYVEDGRVDEFGWGVAVTGLLTGGTASLYRDLGPAWGFVDPADAVVFVDNHDTGRERRTPSRTATCRTRPAPPASGRRRGTPG